MSAKRYPHDHKSTVRRTNATGSISRLSPDHFKGRYGYPDHDPVPTWQLNTEWYTTGHANRTRIDHGKQSYTTDKYRVRAFAKKYAVDISGDFDLMTKAEQNAATQPTEIQK